MRAALASTMHALGRHRFTVALLAAIAAGTTVLAATGIGAPL